MKTKRFLAWLLSIMMIFTTLPLSSLTVFAAGASTPTVDNNQIYANGTPLYIVAGTTSGTAIYYLDGSKKVYLNANGAAGDDMSGTSVWGGYHENDLDGDVYITMTGGKIYRINGGGRDSSNPSGSYVKNVNITISGGTVTYEVNAGYSNPVLGNVNITMTGGSVSKINACISTPQVSSSSSAVKVYGNANITVTGGTLNEVCGGDGYCPIDGTVSGLFTVPVTFVHKTTFGDDRTIAFHNLLYLSGSSYVYRGQVSIPEGVTMTVAAGQSLSIASDKTLINNGTIVNNGTVTINGILRNNGSFINKGTVIRNAAYITTATSGTPSVWVNGSAVSGAVTEYVDGKLYIYGVAGSIKATLNGKSYYGYQENGSSTELTENRIAVTKLSGFPTQMNAYSPLTLKAVVSPENTTLPQTISYEVVDAGGIGATVSGNILNAYGGGTVKLRAKATDGYFTYTEEFSVTVNFVPVTGLISAVPTSMGLGTYILPGVAPSNASNQTVVWSVVDAGGTGATVTGNRLAIKNKGTLKIRCLVENGLAYGRNYTQDFTITAVALDYANISGGSVIISKKDDQTLTVTYDGFEGGSKDYGVKEIIPITGNTTVNTVTVQSGNPIIQITDLSIDVSNTDNACAFSINSGANVTLILSGTNELKSGGGSYNPAGLEVPEGAGIIIEGTGQLSVYSKWDSDGAGIGGSYKQSAGSITINSGTIIATSGDLGAGIGGGYNGSGGTITINGGTVNAKAVEGAGIGGGSYKGSGGTITINGGTVTAQTESRGAGIGGGWHCNGGTITINGGTVNAKSGSNGAGIGGGSNGSGGTITITGGTVTAQSVGIYGAGAGIGGGWEGNGGTVKITGGNVKAIAGNAYTPAIGMGYYGSVDCTLTNGTEDVSLVTITLVGAETDTTVSAVPGITYGIDDVKTLDTNKLYFYLPANTELPARITAGETLYICKFESTYYTEHSMTEASCEIAKICTNCGLTEGNPLGHNYVDGFCSRCGLDENGVYHISTVDQLFSFAKVVNWKNKAANAILEADIDLEGYKWTTICPTDLYNNPTTYEDTGYEGVFDGNGHIIKNIALKGFPGEPKSAGLFGTLSGTIKNLGIETLTFDLNGATDIRAGSIVGQIIGGTVSNCYVKGATIDFNIYVTGGIAGCNYAGTIENSYAVQSAISGSDSRFGYIVGDNRGDFNYYDRVGTINNCYTDADSIAGSRDGNGTVKNSGASVSAERFASGEIAYKLNGSTSVGNLIWGQTIGEDDYPVFGDKIVYYDETNGYFSHAHSWEYTTDGNAIRAICDNADGNCPKTDGGRVTLALPEENKDTYIYTSEPIEAKKDTNELVDTSTKVEVDYAPDEKLTNGKPVNVGEYTASITLGSATIDVTYEITQKELTVKSATATDREYDGTNVVEITAVELEGVCTGDTVAVDTADLTGTLESANAGTYDSVTIPAERLTLTGEHAGNYTLSTATDNKYATSVNINPVSKENFKNLISLQYSVNGGEYTQNAPTTLSYEDKLKVKISFDLENKGSRELPDDDFYVGLGETVESDTLDATTGEVEIEVDTPNVGTNVDLKVYYSNPKNYASATFYYGTVNINKKPVTFNNISGTDQIYESGVAREISFTPSSLTKKDFKVSYYRVDENNNVLASATPVTKAIEPAKYLYVIDFANTQTNYEIANKFTVSGTALPDDVENYDNVGYMLIKSGVTGQQTPIYFKDGTVNLKVNDKYTNELTNDNGTAPTFTSSNTDVATVDSATGEVTAVGKGTATITAKSEKDETTPVYASYTVNVGLATKTLTADDFTVTAKDKTYDGTTDVVISAVLNDGVIYEGDNIKVDITGEFASADVAETGKNTVNYKITGISGTGAENYVLENGQITGTTEASINKAKVTIICATTTTRTFDGTEQSVDVSAMANGAVFDSSNYTVKYNGGEAPSAVGSYPVTVELTEEAAKNYTVTQPSATLVIKSATQEVFSIEGVPEAVYYGDSFTLSAEGASGNVTYAITSGADYATINGANVTIKGVGKVTITATSVKDGYNEKFATKTFNAKPRALTPTATATDRTYNGENGVEVEISLENVVDGDTITAAGTGTMLNADAGNNKIVYVSGITLDGAEKDLYTLDTTSVQTTVNIAKIKIETITVSASDKKYGEATTAAVTDIDEVITADKGQVEVIGTAAFDDENVGENKTVTFTATGLAGSKAGNYYIDELTAETTAAINHVTVNFVVGQTTFVYDGKDKEITVSASDEFGRIFTEFDVEYDETPNEAGEYTATIKFNDENGNYTTTQDDITVTIEEATQDNLVIVGLPGTIQYGDSFELEAVGGEDGGAYEWTVKNNADVTLSEADTATTTVTIGDVVGQKVEIEVVKTTDNYEDISAKVVFVPTAKSVTFDIANLEQTYGEVTDVVVTPSDEDTTYDVTYNGSEELPENAGTYTVKVTANGNYSGMQTATLTIKKATATGTITGINDSYAYGETITGVDVTDLKADTSAEITYAGTGIYVPQDEVPTKVGNYTVIATITGTNYETLTLTENFVIEKAELTVKAVDTERAYGEANPIFELEYTGFVYGETKEVLLAEPIGAVNANASSSVGDYEIKVSGGSAENYKFKYDNTGKLTVTAADGGSLYITGSTNTAYVNDVFTLHAFIGNSKVNVTWESSNSDIAEITANGTVTAKSAGTVTITATADANYGNATATFELTVKQTGITLVPTGLVKTYTGERQDITFVANADFTPVLSGEGKNVDVTYTLISNPSVTEPIQVGTYSVVYIISDGSYTGGGNTTMYIGKATVTAKVKDDSKVYGDEYTDYALEFTDNGGLAESVQASVLEELKALTSFASEGAAKTAIVKDGGYEIIPTLTKTETDNVIFTVENGTLTVTKAPLTVKVKDVTREYGAKNPTLEAEYTGFKNEETKNTKNIFTGELALTYDESISAETAVGEYADTTTASGIEAANYEITFVQGKVTITKIPVKASAGTSRSTYLTVKFNKALPGLTAENFVVKNGEETITLTEVTVSKDQKTYTLKGSFSTSITYTVETTITSDTHEITSGSTLSIKPTSSGGGGGTGGGGTGGGSTGGGSTGGSSDSSTTTYTVTFETNEGSKIDSAKVTKNATVTEPTAPAKDGYTFDGWYTDKELTKAYDFKTKVTKSFTLYAKWTEIEEPDNKDETDGKTDTPDTTEWENPFTDVKADDWYYADVEFAVENGLFNGTTATTFAPDEIITRAMMVTVLYRNEGEPEVTGEATFEDVDNNEYYAKAVVWGQQNGIIKGFSETEFAPDQNITREQIAAIMHRYAEYKGVAPTGAWAIRLDYADLAEISDYATEGVMYCTLKGLMQGKGNNSFAPQDNATRAEIAAILHRFIEANK